MRLHDEFSGTLTLSEETSRELFRVLQEQDESFINDVLDGKCGFTLKSADGRSVELVPNAKAEQTEPNSSEKPNNCEDEISAECKRCKHLKHIPYYGWDCEFEFLEDCKYEPKDKPQTDGILFKGNLKEGDYKLIKTTDGWVLEGEDIVYCGWERSNE